MKKGFTLVELIFVIVIIGVLAAAAIPQFQNLKQNAEANNLVKTVVDGASASVNAAINQIDLEDANISTIQLNEFLQINGKGWTYTPGPGAGTYLYRGPNDTADVGDITFNAAGRTVTYGITCANFIDITTAAKCLKAWPAGVAPAPVGNIADPIILNF